VSEPRLAPAEDSAVAARRLMRQSRSAALATALAGSGGWAYASLVTTACDADASPILLLSGLADHTRNLADDARASLLFEAASGLGNPQTGPRVTVMGRLRETAEERHARRFIARHPAARLYAGFADFHFYRMAVERARYVGGFGSATWVEAADLAVDGAAAAALAADEPAILADLNRDHARALDLCANALLERRGTGWIAIAVDPEGLDLRRRSNVARLHFEHPVADAAACRAALLALAETARRETA